MERVLHVCAGAHDRSPPVDIRWLGVLGTSGAAQMNHQRKAASAHAETATSYFVVESQRAATV